MMPFKTILFATDFSPPSEAAFTIAATLARDYRARIVAVHVIERVPMGFSEFTSYVGTEEDKDRALAELQAIEGSPTLPIERRLLEGDAATVIADAAREMGADLIVMGTHGRTGLTRFVMGSVAEEVVRSALCPVLTVRVPGTQGVTEPVEEEATASI